MTTIILTIIGILLAAAAALMVIFYGGDAFNSGSVGAQANTFQNAGTNVSSAVQMYRAENAEYPDDYDALLDAEGAGGKYLKESPTLPARGTGATAPELDSATGMLTIDAVPTDVCNRINKNLKHTGTVALGDGKMGCAGGVFYAEA